MPTEHVTDAPVGRRTIEGTVAAEASPATATNAPPPPPDFHYRETTHNRLRYVPGPAGGVQRILNQLIERVPEGGEWPHDVARFQLVGNIEMETPKGMIRRGFRFDIPAFTLEEAWKNFDDASGRGYAQMELQFRQEYAAMQQQAAGRVMPASPQEAKAILRP